MVLSDRELRARLPEIMEPYEEANVQPSSIDVRLGNTFRVCENYDVWYVDLANPPKQLTKEVVLDDEETLIIHPGDFVLASTAEFVRMPDDLVCRLEGKALALDTEIPTPRGWTTMGEINVGDYVFGPDGFPRSVVAATEVLKNKDCRLVKFSDGTKLIADVNHQWFVRTRDKCHVLTTGEIELDVKRGRDYRHRVDESQPVLYSEKDLPINPYVLGVWIGDGTSATNEITCFDKPILEEIQLAGVGVRQLRGSSKYNIGGVGSSRDISSGRYVGNESLRTVLRSMGILGYKKIPRKYLQGSIDQRQALLEGLMDTDGYVDKQGRCELTTVKSHLADQYRELIASLGFRPVVSEKPAMLYEKNCGTKYDVTFSPDRPVFRLPRKLARQKTEGKFYRGRSIVSVEKVESVPVRCIQVSADDGLYLVTKSFIPTHNSSVGRLGLTIHVTAGFVDPGFHGVITLEMSNLLRVPIILRPGLLIAQLAFQQLTSPAERPYAGRYQFDQCATESRYGQLIKQEREDQLQRDIEYEMGTDGAGTYDPMGG